MNYEKIQSSQLNFTLDDMQFHDYIWPEYCPASPKFSGLPDNTPFNRENGHEVLYLINEICILWKLHRIESCRKMESMIHQHLPKRLVKQAVVMEWIRKNWEKY